MLWGSAARADVPEDDDYLHNPDPRRDKNIDSMGTIFTARGLANVGCLAIVFIGLLGLLCVLVFHVLGKVAQRLNSGFGDTCGVQCRISNHDVGSG